MGTTRKGSKPKASKNDPRYTDRKQLFVDAYCGPAGLNATKAAEMVGYSPGSTNKLMSDPWVLRAIEQAKEAKREEFKVENQFLVRYNYLGATIDPLDYVELFTKRITKEQLAKIPKEIRQFMHIKKSRQVIIGRDDDGPIMGLEFEVEWVSRMECIKNLCNHTGFGKPASDDTRQVTSLQEDTVRMLLEETRARDNVLDVEYEKRLLIEERKDGGS